MSDTEITFVDELPTIERTVTSGVWVERLAPLRENPGKWARVYGPTNSPHALVNNLRTGNAAGVNGDEFQFAGRMLGTGKMVDVLDDEGNPTGAQEEVKEGYVYAKFLTAEERKERDKERRARERQAAKAEAEAEAANA